MQVTPSSLGSRLGVSGSYGPAVFAPGRLGGFGIHSFPVCVEEPRGLLRTPGAEKEIANDFKPSF